MEVLKWLGITICGGLSYLFGGFDVLLTTLLVMETLDYLTGCGKAFKNKELDWNIGVTGIIKKFFVLVIVIVSNLLTITYNLPIRDLIISAFTFNEVLSILKNVNVLYKLPESVKNIIEKFLKERGNNNGMD